MLNKYWFKRGLFAVEIEPRLEPIFDTSLSYVCCSELLCRVKREGFFLKPDEFFSSAGVHIQTSIYEGVLLSNLGHLPRRISINIKGGMLRNERFMALQESISDKLEIVFEVSEKSASIAALPTVPCCEIKSKELWLDDFGTLNSNFDALDNKLFSGVKIAKEFFWQMNKGNEKFYIELVRFLKSRNYRVIMEGVDSMERFEFCKKIGCLAQGYYVNELVMGTWK